MKNNTDKMMAIASTVTEEKPEVQRTLTGVLNPHVRKALAANHRALPEVVALLSRDENREVAASALMNPRLPKDRMNELLQSFGPPEDLVMALSKNPSVGSRQVKKLHERGSFFAATAIVHAKLVDDNMMWNYVKYVLCAESDTYKAQAVEKIAMHRQALRRILDSPEASEKTMRMTLEKLPRDMALDFLDGARNLNEGYAQALYSTGIHDVQVRLLQRQDLPEAVILNAVKDGLKPYYGPTFVLTLIARNPSITARVVSALMEGIDDLPNNVKEPIIGALYMNNREKMLW